MRGGLAVVAAEPLESRRLVMVIRLPDYSLIQVNLKTRRVK